MSLPEDDLILLFENTDEVLWFADCKQHKLTSISPSCEKVYGYTPKQFLNNYALLKEVVNPEDRKQVNRNDDLLSQGQKVKAQYRITHADGSIRHVQATTIPVLNENGELTKLLGFVRDITSQKRASRALMEGEYLLRQFFENAYEAILVIKGSTRQVHDYNKNALKLFGIDSSEILGKTFIDFCPEFQPDGQSSVSKADNLIRHLMNESNVLSEWVLKDTAGREILCELNFTGVTYNNDALVRISIVDVTDEKRTKRKLAKQEILYAKLLENISEGVALIGAGGEILYQSPSGERVMGFSMDDLRELTILDLVHPDDLPGLNTLFADLLTTPATPFSRQFRFKHKTGGYQWVEGTMVNMLHDENIQAFVANFRNIEERKKAEEQIAALNESLEIKVAERTAELLETNQELEAFSYTASHDLKAPLRTMSGFASILMKDYGYKLDDDGRRFLQVISDSSNRMSRLINDLLEFSRLGKQELTKGNVDMDALVEEVLNGLPQSTLPTPQITVGKLNNTLGDAALLKQVWINLITNAIKYSGKKDKPVIEIGFLDNEGEPVYYIKDNGAGFDMKYADNLFTAFKRMHDNAEFEGTGIGLATVHRIIMRHNGQIWAEARPNEGATFYFTLPV